MRFFLASLTGAGVEIGARNLAALQRAVAAFVAVRLGQAAAWTPVRAD